ncbi:MAG: flagellar capping protein [Clostridia bacterium]|jgi:flagellar hook-associated protein 2|nr:flagellar capping protein [Clostridia bacterium]
MSSNISSMLNNKIRFSGMASGLDTESIISQLMNVEKMKVDKVKQQKQALEWKKDSYRNITNLLRSFKDDYFNILKPESNMRSANTYISNTAASSASDVATATANSSAISTTHQISVTSLATAAKVTSTGVVTSALESNGAITDFNFGAGKTFSINLNGVVKSITVTGDFSGDASPIESLKTSLQNSIDNAFGAGKIAIGFSAVDNTIEFSTADGRITLTGSAGGALEQMNIASGSSNRLNANTYLSSLNIQGGLSGVLEFSINGQNFSFDTTTKTLNDLIREVNSSAANVTLGYSEITDSFTLTSKQLGAGETITIANTTGNFFGAGSAIKIGNTSVSNGTDAKFDLDGVIGITRSSNEFSIDGVSYKLLKEGASASISISKNVDEAYKKITNFIGKYNEIVDKLNGEYTQSKNRNYLPLTDEQREVMSESDIEKWEAKAKEGLLKGDSILNGVVSNMRYAISESITGVSKSLSAIGIKSTSYLDKGKLFIDEVKLKEALQNSPEEVMNIFSKESDIGYSRDLSSAQKKERYEESGIINRLYDIIEENISTIRNTNGKKGALLEKAGLAGDVSEFKNLLSEEIDNKSDLILTLNDKLYKKENFYYAKFSALEKAMSQMNSQSSWLAQQFGGGA